METNKKFAKRFVSLLNEEETLDLTPPSDTGDFDSQALDSEMKPEDSEKLGSELDTLKNDANDVGNATNYDLMKELGQKYARDIDKINDKLAMLLQKIIGKKEFEDMVNFEPSDIQKKLNDLKINLTTGLVEEIEKRLKKDAPKAI